MSSGDTCVTQSSLQAATSNLGMYTAAKLDVSVGLGKARLLEIRSLWLWGRISKLQGEESKAVAYFEACHALCDGGSLRIPQSDRHGPGSEHQEDQDAMEQGSGLHAGRLLAMQDPQAHLRLTFHRSMDIGGRSQCAVCGHARMRMHIFRFSTPCEGVYLVKGYSKSSSNFTAARSDILLTQLAQVSSVRPSTRLL